MSQFSPPSVPAESDWRMPMKGQVPVLPRIQPETQYVRPGTTAMLDRVNTLPAEYLSVSRRKRPEHAELSVIVVIGSEPPRGRYQRDAPDSQSSEKSTLVHVVGQPEPVHVADGGHVTLSHRPAVHTNPLPQVMPHAPQLELVTSAVSHPFESMPSQLP